MRFSICLLAVCMLPGPVAAAPLVIDFMFASVGYNAVLDETRDAGIEIQESNFGSYSYYIDGLTLGNDGLLSRASLIAAPGLVFDALTADLRSLRGNLEVLSCDGIGHFTDPDSPDTMVSCATGSGPNRYYSSMVALSPPTYRGPNLFFMGYRSGPDPVAIATLKEPAAGVIDIAALGDFTALTRLVVSITQTGFFWLFDPVENAWIGCQGGLSCGVAIFDSVSLDLRPAAAPGVSAPVPLPAPALLLAAGLAGLGLLRRRACADT